MPIGAGVMMWIWDRPTLQPDLDKTAFTIHGLGGDHAFDDIGWVSATVMTGSVLGLPDEWLSWETTGWPSGMFDPEAPDLPTTGTIPTPDPQPVNTVIRAQWFDAHRLDIEISTAEWLINTDAGAFTVDSEQADSKTLGLNPHTMRLHFPSVHAPGTTWDADPINFPIAMDNGGILNEYTGTTT